MFDAVQQPGQFDLLCSSLVLSKHMCSVSVTFVCVAQFTAGSHSQVGRDRRWGYAASHHNAADALSRGKQYAADNCSTTSYAWVDFSFVGVALIAAPSGFICHILSLRCTLVVMVAVRRC